MLFFLNTRMVEVPSTSRSLTMGRGLPMVMGSRHVEGEVDGGATVDGASAQFRPSCRSMIRRTLARPMPVPGNPLASWSRWNGWNSSPVYAGRSRPRCRARSSRRARP